MTAPRLIHSAPVLLVSDVVRSANHYRDALGFSYDRFHGEPPGLVILRRDGLFLMLKQVSPEKVIPHTASADGLWSAYFWVSDADALHAEYVRRGAVIDYGPCDQPYGCREFGIRDPDGHDIGFGQSID